MYIDLHLYCYMYVLSCGEYGRGEGCVEGLAGETGGKETAGET